MKQPGQPFRIQHKLVTLQDVAQRCGFTKSTVSRALLNDPRVKPTTRSHILAIAEEMGYNPSQNAAARRLVLRGRGMDILNHNVALCIRSDMYTVNYYMLVFKGIVDELAHTDFTLLMLLAPPNEQDAVRALPPTFERGDIDGIITCAGINIPGALDLFRRHPLLKNCPVVGTVTKDVGSTSVVLGDEAQGAYLSAKHLLELGHREIIHYQGHAGQENYQKRLAGVRRAFSEYGLDAETHIHSMPFPQVWIEPHGLGNGKTGAGELSDDAMQFSARLLATLRDHPRITAILPLNDANAIRIWRVLQDEGYRVPDDISIIGFDDTDPMMDLQGQNLLTSVRLPLEEIGREAVRLLMRQIEMHQLDPVEVVLPVELMLRQSTAPAHPRA